MKVGSASTFFGLDSKNEPCEVIKDRFRRFHELVVYDDARREINYTHSCQLLAILGDTLYSINKYVSQFEYETTKSSEKEG